MQVKICYTNKACSETVTEGLKMKYLFFTSSFRNATIKIHICENDHVYAIIKRVNLLYISMLC